MSNIFDAIHGRLTALSSDINNLPPQFNRLELLWRGQPLESFALFPTSRALFNGVRSHARRQGAKDSSAVGS